MAIDDVKQYVLGRGRLYFDKFAPNTTVGIGERYLGNTPALAMNSTYTNLDHFDADEGVREKDDSVQIQNDRSGTFATDNISIENVALMFGGDTAIETMGAVTGTAEVLTVQRGLYYQLGTDDDLPQGVSDVSSVIVTDNTGARATGGYTVGDNPTAADTITINGQAITFVAGAPVGFQVQIGATTDVTASSIRTLVNANPDTFDVVATGTGTTVTLTAIATGVGGNAIATLENVTGAGFTVAGATLAGGTASGIIPESGNYEIDLELGRLHILSTSASIADDDEIEVTYNVVGGSRSLALDESNQVEGALRFISNNPKGPQKDFFWPRVKLTPNGEFALKGDTWQTINFNFDVLKKGTLKRVYVNER